MLYTACQERAGSCASGRSFLQSHGHTAQLGLCLHRTDIVFCSPATPSPLQPGVRLRTLPEATGLLTYACWLTCLYFAGSSCQNWVWGS